MSEPERAKDETVLDEQLLLPGEQLATKITLDVPAGGFLLEWTRPNGECAGRARLSPSLALEFNWRTVDCVIERGQTVEYDRCTAWPSSVGAFLTRLRKRFPCSNASVQFGVLANAEMGPFAIGSWSPVSIPSRADAWKWFGQHLRAYSSMLESMPPQPPDLVQPGKVAAYLLGCALLGVTPVPPPLVGQGQGPLLFLRVTFDQTTGRAEFVWSHPRTRVVVAQGIVIPSPHRLTWELETREGREPTITSLERSSIRSTLGKWLQRFPTDRTTFCGFWIEPGPDGAPITTQEPPFGRDESPYEWIEDNIACMASAARLASNHLSSVSSEWETLPDFERYQRRLDRKAQKRAQEQARQAETMARLAEERRVREAQRAQARAARLAAQAKAQPTVAPIPARAQLPLPPVPVRLELPPLSFQETAFPLTDLQPLLLRERAALWWVSNQSDDLLSLPHCRIQHLEYQLRTALRVLGPLRGRALLSDEVGLGKTIEAGLVTKELLTRGMIKRFLVLTVPSLVDQWEEELSDKFGLATVTTNMAEARINAAQFWRANPGIVASLHTLKQSAHLEVARQVHWDILIVDEAHHLRNRDSQAWQAVNVLPRQFLLLLTATPVQNSLEELYNLVTLLQPGQLPSPKEFRARFMDPKQPRRPRDPEQLRRLLGQVMIRNTRANAEVQLPPRRAETVFFTSEAQETEFWQKWEPEFRTTLSKLHGSQANLWGRLILQAAGSSPAAWIAALAKYPQPIAQTWREQAPLQASWQKKCQLLPPLTRVEGGVVVFTQFLETQAALAGFLGAAGVRTFLINGSTPAVERQPITDEFRKHGGSLLLTHSGTEGRNLQFCHRLVNFDLPWNPMEIEQRIGRLHRLGQQHPVRIYNFVQAGTLQEHLLDILQEKLNLFELVVGETGLVLGEKFSSEEFAEEILRLWRESEGRVAEAISTLGDELAAARRQYGEIKQLDETLFAKDYESL